MGTVEQATDVISRDPTASSFTASLRWDLLRRSLLTSSRGSRADEELIKISRRPAGRYNLITSRVLLHRGHEEDLVEAACEDAEDVEVEYLLPVYPTKLTVRQRCNRLTKLRDLDICQENRIDNTGIVCMWPAEEVLTYFCVRHSEIFRNKTVIEIGSGYGLGGLAIAACAEATEVVITDGNPQVLEYIQHNIRANDCAFGNTRVSSSALYWNRETIPLSGRTFDLVVAADCTFFKDFHIDLACTIKSLLGKSKDSRAIFFNPRRGNSLDLFVHAAESVGLSIEIKEQYDAQLWEIHQGNIRGDNRGWPNYDSNHDYPLFLSITSCEGALLAPDKLRYARHEIPE